MTKVKQSSFHNVHDTQAIYRALLDTMARPGKINNISQQCDRLEVPDSLPTILAGLAYTLLDREVTFSVVGEALTEAEQYLHWQTFSPIRSLDVSDYVFVLQTISPEEVEALMNSVKRGTLEDPHLSATIFVMVEALCEQETEGLTLDLKGPGINGVKTVTLQGLPDTWFKMREKVNEEYPLGVDIIFATEAGDLLALPRTTITESR